METEDIQEIERELEEGLCKKCKRNDAVQGGLCGSCLDEINHM